MASSAKSREDLLGQIPPQLITPLLTPVSEESPFPEPALPANGHNDNTSPDSFSKTSKLTRARSSSVPAVDSNQPVTNGNVSLASRRLTTASSNPTKHSAQREVHKLTSAQIQELTSAPDSLPLRSASSIGHDPETSPTNHESKYIAKTVDPAGPELHPFKTNGQIHPPSGSSVNHMTSLENDKFTLKQPLMPDNFWPLPSSQNGTATKSVEKSKQVAQDKDSSEAPPPSSLPDSLPLPPLSMPTYLHLELSVDRPSPLYIHQPAKGYVPYEEISVKFERLLNFLLLPPQLERTLWFGAFACLDAWLYNFTILPLRFLKALWVLFEWASTNFANEAQFLTGFVWSGSGRLWSRRQENLRRNSEASNPSRKASEVDYATNSGSQIQQDMARLRNTSGKDSQTNGPAVEAAKMDQTSPRIKQSRHSRSVPSSLQPNHKADLLQGTMIIASCIVLSRFDASKIYHTIRVQGAIKLYVIYNVLEVCDRLFSALGQDIMECLFSPETLNRWPNGRSKVIKPFWMFILGLVYTVSHATAFFYQVITLNVAFNSYSNALLTLLMSNQFVEIKSTVFKKFEKENLFQLSCADVVERFQLWLILVIIALRNIVEMGGLSVASSSDAFSGPSSHDLGDGIAGGFDAPINSTGSNIPFNILPNAFTMLPSLFPVHVLVPFLVVLGVEMLVDWLKHAYITKFNAVSPYIYARFYDVLTKDYYSTAFHPQHELGMIRRLGLPTIPLACLFIRAILQTYHMFLSSTISSPALSAATGLAEVAADGSTTASEGYFDHFLLRALGRSSFGGGHTTLANSTALSWLRRWTLDDAIALTTMLAFFLVFYLLLLAFKLILGMVLLRISRNRYRKLQDRERRTEHDRQRGRSLTQDRSVNYSIPAKRVGAWGSVEIGDERRKIIYENDPDGLARLQDREARAREKERARVEALSLGKGDALDTVDRYRMVAKRIW